MQPEKIFQKIPTPLNPSVAHLTKVALPIRMCHTDLMNSNFHPVRLLEFNPHPQWPWLTVAEVEVIGAIQDWRDDAVARAVESCREEHLPRVEWN